jgi:TolB protein
MVTIGRRRRSPWLWVGLAVAAVLVIGGLWLAVPRLVSTSPPDGLADAANDTAVTLTFSRPMDHASVQGHLSLQPNVPGRFVWQGNELSFVPTEPWEDGVSVRVSFSPGAISRLFLPLLTGHDWSFQVRAPRLIYAEQEQAGAQLFTRDLGEGQGEMLTSAPLGVADYSSAEGSGDVFYLTPSVEGGQAVHSVDVRTGSDRSVMACPSVGCRRLGLSRDGTWLTLEAQPGPQGSPTGPGEVWAAPVDGSQDAQRLGAPGHDLRNALWGPGDRLAVYDATGSTMLVFDGPPDFNVLAEIPNKLGEMGAWSPDGRYLIYPEIVFINPTATPSAGAAREPEYYSHIFRYDIETDQTTDLSGGSSGLIEDASPAYSPDGRWIAFARKSLVPARWTLGRQLWLMRADGSQARPLTSQPVMNYSTFAWRPGSTALVYVQSNQADPTKPPELGWLDVSTGQTHSLVQGGYAPSWIP